MLKGDILFTVAILICVALATIAYKKLPDLLFESNDKKGVGTARLVLIFLLLSWGPFAAFQFGHLPGLASFFITSGQQGLSHAAISATGFPLQALVQLGAIWLGVIMAFTVCLGLTWRSHRGGQEITAKKALIVLGVTLFYPLLNSWIVL